MANYRLQTLLEIRERAEEEAKQVFAEAMSQLHREQQLLQEMKDELERMIEDRKRRRFIDRLKEKESEQKGVIDGQRENVREAEKQVKRAQDALIAATQDLKALQKHKEKWQEAVKRERALKEADMLDEIAQTIYQQRDKQ